MKRAWLGLRDSVHYRREAFAAGLEACGYKVMNGITERPAINDVLIIWNRYGEFDHCAAAFEQRGLPVLIAENGYLGNDFCGDRWYALARSQHNGAGTWPLGDASRWDSLGVDLAPWRPEGEIVVLPQRGIGPKGVAMPRDWVKRTERFLRERNINYRVRPHPGKAESIPLDVDLKSAGAVVTWGSGAAIRALTMGIPVFYDFKRWIGGRAGEPLNSIALGRYRNDLARQSMFRALAWAQWTIKEIKDGTAFAHLLR